MDLENLSQLKYIKHTLSKKTCIQLKSECSTQCKTIDEPHLPAKIHSCSPYSVGHIYHVARYITCCTGVTRRWRLISHERNKVRWLTLSMTMIYSKSYVQTYSLYHIVYVVSLYMVMQIQSLLSIVVQNIASLDFIPNRHTLKGISQLDCDSYTQWLHVHRKQQT